MGKRYIFFFSHIGKKRENAVCVEIFFFVCVLTDLRSEAAAWGAESRPLPPTSLLW